jgi:exodeoxyribonuclease VII small subunit
MTKKSITYNEAIRELNTILEEFESEQVDVDHIRDKVKRAIALITLCRQRIEKTELEVRKIVKDFEKDISKQQETTNVT